MWRRKGKYNSRKTVYNGVEYDSKKEADYARDLDFRLKAGELLGWKRQIPLAFVVNGILVCKYKVDFVEIHHDGEVYVEIKGHKTPVWRLKWKLFEACFPELKKQVVT